MLQLIAAVAAISLDRVLGADGLLGLGPAIVLSAGALAAVPAGRAMDHFGRIPVLAAGFGLGAASCGLAALGSAHDFRATDPCRAGRGGDRVVVTRSPGRRAVTCTRLSAERAGSRSSSSAPSSARSSGRRSSGPVLAGRELDGESLAALWLAAGAFELVGLALVAAVRPDPMRIAALLRHEHVEPGRTRTAPIGELLRRPGVVLALVAGQASFGVMVAVMTLTGSVVVDHFHHEQHDVFPIIAAHFVGMYALVILVGDLVDRIGRTPGAGRRADRDGPVGKRSPVGGGRPCHGGRALRPRARTGTSRSSPRRRSSRSAPSLLSGASLLGFTDLLSGATGAALTLLGGLALTAGGVAALAIGAVVLVTIPALWDLRARPRRHALQMDSEGLGRRPSTSTRGWRNLEATR